MQNNNPVAFYSRKMTDPERDYVNHEQELLAAIVALKEFRCYLLGNHFTLITVTSPILTWTHSPHCHADRLAGVNTCSVSISVGYTSLESSMLQTL